MEYNDIFGTSIDTIHYTDSMFSYNFSKISFFNLMKEFSAGNFKIPKKEYKIWSKEKISYLLVSMIMGIPIPPIYISLNEYNEYIVLDGAQRILSLFVYYCDLIPKENAIINMAEFNDFDFDIFNNFENSIRNYAKKNPNFFENVNIDKINNTYDMTKLKFKYYTFTNFNIQDFTYGSLSEKQLNIVREKAISLCNIKTSKGNKKSALLNVAKLLKMPNESIDIQNMRELIYPEYLVQDLRNINNNLYKSSSIWKKINKVVNGVEILLAIGALNEYTNIDMYGNVKIIDRNYLLSLSGLIDKYLILCEKKNIIFLNDITLEWLLTYICNLLKEFNMETVSLINMLIDLCVICSKEDDVTIFYENLDFLNNITLKLFKNANYNDLINDKITFNNIEQRLKIVYYIYKGEFR